MMMVSSCTPQELQSLISGLVGTPVPTDQPLMEAGLDSIGAVELRNSVSASFGVDLPATVTFDYPTIAALAQFVGQRTGAQHSAGGAQAGAVAAMQSSQQQQQGMQPDQTAIAAQVIAILSELLGFAVPGVQVWIQQPSDGPPRMLDSKLHQTLICEHLLERVCTCVYAANDGGRTGLHRGSGDAQLHHGQVWR